MAVCRGRDVLHPDLLLAVAVDILLAEGRHGFGGDDPALGPLDLDQEHHIPPARIEIKRPLRGPRPPRDEPVRRQDLVPGLRLRGVAPVVVAGHLTPSPGRGSVPGRDSELPPAYAGGPPALPLQPRRGRPRRVRPRTGRSY